MEQTLLSQSSPVTAQPSRKRSKSKFIKWKKDFKWKKTHKKPSRERVEVHQIRVDVASYQEFQSLLRKYVTQKAVPVSFNVSDNLDSESYDKIVKDLLHSNSSNKGNAKEVFRCDKIERPRANPRPRQTIECCTLEELKKVHGVMGRFWSPRICLPQKDDGSENDKLHAQMCEFIKYAVTDSFQILVSERL